MKELLGKKIIGISLSKDQTFITFHTDCGDVSFKAWGGCCSESYFSQMYGFNNIEDSSKVSSVEEIELGSAEGTKQEVDTVYGFKIKLGEDKVYFSAPSILLIMRNSSNGYYGGSVDFIEQSRLSSLEDVPVMEKITKDFDF